MFNVPADVIERFRALGAVRASVSHFPDDRERGHRECLDKNLIYFWDAQGREIGYWNRVMEVDQVFAPNHRDWGDEFLAIQRYESLPAVPKGDGCEQEERREEAQVRRHPQGGAEGHAGADGRVQG